MKAHTKNTPKFYKQLGEWGIRSMADEEKALEELQPKTKTIAEAAVEMASEPEAPKPETPKTAPAIDWFSFGTEPQTTEATVSIADKSFAFDAWTANTINVKPGDRVAIGYADGKLYFR